MARHMLSGKKDRIVSTIAHCEERKRDSIIAVYIFRLMPNAYRKANGDRDFANIIVTNTMLTFVADYPTKFMGRDLAINSTDLTRYMFKTLNYEFFELLRIRKADDFLTFAKLPDDKFWDYFEQVNQNFQEGDARPELIEFAKEYLKKLLSPLQFEVYIRFVALGHSHGKIAYELETSINTTKSTLSQARKKILDSPFTKTEFDNF